MSLETATGVYEYAQSVCAYTSSVHKLAEHQGDLIKIQDEEIKALQSKTGTQGLIMIFLFILIMFSIITRP